MKISGMEFPDPLLDALRDGRVVVFAGAGVSMGEPANLPDFSTLVDKVAQGTGMSRRDGEQEDQFLGRLKQNGVNVHGRVRDVLCSYDPKPNGLHRDLLRLFLTPQSVRLVTTNFDNLFEQAADEILDTIPRTFTAPALPRGKNFSGIVHVHGSLDSPDEMVLTDSDFGVAYLTERWAGQFLVDLFQSFPILFVGYSHNDTVVSYLARALPSEVVSPRFALTDNASTEQWSLLGITPIIYAKRPDPNSHGALYERIRELAKLQQRGILDWQAQISGIARKTPQVLDDRDEHLIATTFSDPMYTRFFADAASDPDWVEWLDQMGYLSSLFPRNMTDHSKIDERLGSWLSARFVREHSNHLFRLIARHGSGISPYFWRCLEGAVIVAVQDDALDANVLARWVSLLIATAPEFPHLRSLQSLGEACHKLGLTKCVIEVFDELTKGKLQLESHTYEHGGNSSVGAELVDASDLDDAGEIWKVCLKPNLDQIAEALLTRVAYRLERRYVALDTWQRASWDLWDRSAIEPHEQDENSPARQTLHTLVDAARDCLEHIVSTSSQDGAFWCSRFARSDVPLLRRLAVHVLPLREDLQADEKIEWLLSPIGLHYHPAKHEIFRAMESIYPNASRPYRGAVIAEVLAYRWPKPEQPDSERKAAYVHFEWLHWLQRANPQCDLVQQPIANLRLEYPDFQLSEHPDFGSYTSGVTIRGYQSPWTVDDLLSRPVRSQIHDLLTFQQTDLFGPDRDGLLDAIRTAATQEFAWGLALADELIGMGEWDAEIWIAILRAWSQKLEGDGCCQVLDRLAHSQLYTKHIRPVADVLYALVKESGESCTAQYLGRANQLATNLWEHIDQGESLQGIDDSLMQAINHPAGIVAEFWLASLGLWRNQVDPRPQSLGNEYSGAFTRIIHDATLNGRLGKAVLASRLRFLLTADETWTMEHLVPLFDSANLDDRRSVWGGFAYENLGPQVANALESSFLQTVPLMDVLFPDQSTTRERFVQHYTSMAIYAIDDPIDIWIPSLFNNCKIEDRCVLARHIGDILRRMEDDKQRELWTRWLKQYLGNRLNGVPLPLDDQETESILDWLPWIRGLFPEAVDLAMRIPPAPLNHLSVIYHLSQDDCQLPLQFPEATARLLVHLSQFTLQAHAWHFGPKLVDRLLGLDLPQTLDKQLKEIRAKLT